MANWNWPSKVMDAYNEARGLFVGDAETDFLCETEVIHQMTPIEALMFLSLVRCRLLLSSLKIKPQEPVGPYRADFVVEMDGLAAVIECDGHDFHEKTRDQAAHDRKRDRTMQLMGMKVFRFTGSEVWKDADACVAEALSLGRI